MVDVTEVTDQVKAGAAKVVTWRDWAVNFASAHPKTTLFVLGVSAVLNVVLAIKSVL